MFFVSFSDSFGLERGLLMAIVIGIPRESTPGETRVAGTPDSVKRLCGLGYTVCIEKGLGEAAGFSDEQYTEAGARITDATGVWPSPVVLKIVRPTLSEIERMKQGSLLLSFLDPFASLHDG